MHGECLDQMNEPQPFTSKIRLKAYLTVEMGGIIWTYMGPREWAPPPPRFAWTRAPESHRHVTKVIQECNWLQTLEGGLDASHALILHSALTPSGNGYSPTHPFVKGQTPRYEVDVTDYGYRYFGVRSLDQQGRYIRAYHYVMPFTQIRPNGSGQDHGHMWVPMDDESCMVWIGVSLFWLKAEAMVNPEFVSD